jgi:dTDP-4-amino-4,6-dideoxygalactose transaminase
MNVPFNDFLAHYQAIKPEIDGAIQRVLDSGWFILGPELEAFEAEFATYCGAQQSVGVASGTEALQIALLALGIGPGDEVITVSHTAVPTVAAIEMTGARPVLVDINPFTYTMNPQALDAAITSRTRVVLPVHLYGQPADMDAIIAVSRRHELAIVEDVAQAVGAEYRGRQVGVLGDIAAYSFYPTKNLGAFGDAGAIVTNDQALAEKARRLRNYGQAKRYHHQMKGMNSRLDEMQAAILRAKLLHLEGWNYARRERAGIYDRLLSSAQAGVQPPMEADWARHVYHLYVVRTNQRDALQQHLANAGVSTLIHYPIPVHLQEAYADLGLKRGTLPVTEVVAEQILSLPIYPELTIEQVSYVAGQIRDFTRLKG